MNVGPKQMPAENVALEFACALARRDYRTAYDMSSSEFQAKLSCEEMQQAFESIVPNDWGTVDPIEIGTTMDDWPARRATDAGWVYVGLGGTVYSEGLVVIVTNEKGVLKIREVEWGRP
jgi:hypothetical protein